MRAAAPVFDFAPGPWFSGAPEENVAETSVPTSTPSHLRLSPAWLLFAALALAIPIAPMLVSRRAPALPELGELPAFALTDQLRQYSETYGAREDVWRFLTGSPTEVERTVVKGFKIAMAKMPANEPAQSEDELRAEAIDILHGDRLVLVDSRAHIRGYYVADDAGLSAVLRDARALSAP